MPLTIPSLEEQRNVVGFLAACDDVVSQAEAQLGSLELERAALLQSLVMGKYRVALDTAA